MSAWHLQVTEKERKVLTEYCIYLFIYLCMAQCKALTVTTASNINCFYVQDIQNALLYFAQQGNPCHFS